MVGPNPNWAGLWEGPTERGKGPNPNLKGGFPSPFMKGVGAGTLARLGGGPGGRGGFTRSVWDFGFLGRGLGERGREEGDVIGCLVGLVL